MTVAASLAAEARSARVLKDIEIPRDRIAELCRRWHIRKLAFFGSVLTEDFGPESDVDVLVEFEPGKTPGWEIFDIKDELAGMLGRKVDRRTPQDLSRYFRDEVVARAEIAYRG
jgi:predicted nucleotidyltransferase